ncbi:MAG: hypothetical protein KDA51_14245, partial [Planctomycetales bacterium]|nr:hypothetical protein [Planctomycetales bacterium]
AQSWRGLQFPRRGKRGDDNAAVPLGHATAAELSSHGDVGAIDVLGRAYFPVSDDADGKAMLPTVAQPTQPLRALHHTGSNWLACGAQGELISSRDGAQWTNVVVPLSQTARQLCQWRSITQIEDTVWVCGYPGSILLTSPDRGATWQVKKTGQTLPLSAMHFVDQSRGWATGPLGLILATRDAGQTWYAQRQRARRLGVLAVSNTTLDLPWTPLAASAWDEQVAVAATVYQAIDPIEQAGFLPSRWASYHDLAPQIGLAGLFSQSMTEETSASLSNRMALELRCWRPDVVLLGEGDSQRVGQQRGLKPSLESELLTAMKISGEAHALMSDELDLPAWSATKLVSTCAVEQSQYSEQSSRLLRTPGISIWDCLLPLPPEDRRTTESSKVITTMRTVWTQSQAKSAFSTLLGAVPATIENQRQVNIQNIGNFQLVMGRIHRDRSVDRLAQTSNNMQPLGQWSSDLEFVMRSVPARESAAVLQRLAQQLSLSQHWPQRKIVCQRLIDLEPHSDLADWARWELLTLDVSDECAAWRRSEARRSSDLQQAAFLSMPPVPVPGNSAARGPLGSWWGNDVGAQTAAWNATPFGVVNPVRDQQPTMNSTVVSASGALPLAAPDAPVPSTSDEPSSNSKAPVVRTQDATLFDANAGQMSAVVDRSSQALSADVARHQLLHATQIQSPVLLARPDLELRQFSCDRLTQSTIQSSDEGLARLKHLASAGPLIGWPQMAQQELGLWFGHASGLRWTVAAESTDRPPLLDGTLNDPFWQRANVMELTELDATTQTTQTTQVTQALQATQIRWAYDHEYLYVGIISPRPNDDTPLPVAERRGYDADLSGVDHVQLTLDTDRDYCTAIELGIAADGRTYDRCCGCADYNPKWHVSVRSQTGQWTAELAIELDALTTQTDLSGKAWAVSARRLQPDGNHQSWSRLRSHAAYLNASGLLLFAGTTDSQ